MLNWFYCYLSKLYLSQGFFLNIINGGWKILFVQDVSGFSRFVKFVLPERVDEVVDTPPYLKFGNPAYGVRFLDEVEKVNRGEYWDNLIFAAQAVRLARLEPSVPYVCRGSAGSSLLCYLVGITNIDPVKSGISVARFLSGGRDNPPDIDLDFPAELRPEMWKRLRARFGDRIGFVATKLKYRKKSALREALRRCGIHFDFWLAQAPVISQSQRQRVLELASSLEGKTYGLSRHCGGIVFFPKGVPSQYLSARCKEPFSQLILDKKELEKVGYGKLDILSNYALSHLRYVGVNPDRPEEIMDAGSSVGNLFSSGNSWGIVQAESPAMRKLLVNLKVSSMEGLTLALGLIRPAVSGGSLKPPAVGRNPVERMLVYEDDVAEFLSVLLGGSMSLGEYSRRLLVKGGQEAKKLLKDVGRLVNTKGRDRVLFRGRYWTWGEVKRQLGLAAAYSFCKSHATAYGRVVWALGWCKAYNPTLFWEGFLNTAISSSMYLPWVHMERIKRELDMRVRWPGDFSLSPGMFFKVPWVVDGDKKVVYPKPLYSSSLPSFSLTPCSELRSMGYEQLELFDSFDSEAKMLLRQLKLCGFWAGTRGEVGPLSKTYLVEKEATQGVYDFRGLRALKSPRLHPLDGNSLCLFQTLGVGGAFELKTIETSMVFSKTSSLLSQKLEEASKSLYLGFQAQGSSNGNTYYFKPL